MKNIAILLTAITLVSCNQGGDKNTQTDTKKPDLQTTDVKTSNVPADWKTYSHDNYSIQYPSTWEMKESDGTVSVFSIEAPMDTAKAIMGENIQLSVQDMRGQAIPLDKVADAAIGQFKDILTNFTLLSNKKLTDGTGDYQQVIFSGEQGSIVMIFEQWYRIINDKLYVLNLTGAKENWDKGGQKIGEQILGSFMVKK